MSKYKFFYSLVLVVCSFCITPNIASSQHFEAKTDTSTVGTLRGNFQVTPTGQAHYSIPIDVPPGTAGMVPALSIVYDSTSSNVKNGLLGMGFSLDGLTAITRCPANKTQNGFIHGVDFTDQDRFCLNGEQLVAIKGAYGADGTEYRTYNNTQVKVVSYGHQGNGPAKFKVWTKGGQVAEYGATSDSQVQVKQQDKNAVSFWGLNRIEDTAGNYLKVSYFKDEANGSFYPIEVIYTGNEKAKISPYNSIKFVYEDRPDVKTTYQAGAKNTLDKRLKAIQTYHGSSLIYEYRLVYEVSKNTSRSRITTIQKCTGSGICLPPTKFEWQTNEEGWEEESSFKPPVAFNYLGGDYGVQLVDLNGDGLPDMVWGVRGGHTGSAAWINDGTKWVENSDYKPRKELSALESGNSPRGGEYGIRFIDLNGNGLPDMLWSVDGGFKGSLAWVNDGTQWVENSGYIPPKPFVLEDRHSYMSGDHGVKLVDLNGDGLPDMLWSVSGGFVGSLAWINDGTQWVENSGYIPPKPFVLEDRHSYMSGDHGVRLVDLNGDGLPDMLWSVDGGFKGSSVWINDGTQWIEIKNSGYIPPKPFVLEDRHSYMSQDRGVILVDLNGDGLPDMLWGLREGSDGSSAWLNDGKKWAENGNYVPPKPFIGGGVRIVDLNGNGLPDILWSVDKNSVAWLNKAKKLPDYLISITDGLGTKITIDYESLSSKKENVYTKENDAEYPNMDWQGPMYVVHKTSSETASNDPNVSTNGSDSLSHVTTYHYIGAKFNHLGLGFLGFHKVISTDQSTGISTTTTYSQDIGAHNIGMSVAAETRWGDTLLSHSQNIWDLKVFGDGKVNTTYYFPYVKKSIKESYSLEGNLLSNTTIDNIFDDYANPLGIATNTYDQTTRETYTTVTENRYKNNPDKWFLGELIEAKVTKSATNRATQTKISRFGYDSETSLLMETIAQPDDPKLALTTKYERDLFGNIESTTISGNGIEPRTTKTKYDDYGRFVKQVTNPLNQTTSQVVDPRFGVVKESYDFNGLKTIYEYDDFARQEKEISSDGTQTDVKYSWFEPTSVPLGETSTALKYCSYVVTSHTQNSTTQREYFDILGRKIAAVTQGLNGKDIWQLIYYDDLGRISQKSQPFFVGDPIYLTTIKYDVLGRMIRSTLPDGSFSTIDYNGFSTTTTNQLGHKQIKQVNALGELISATDNIGSVTTYKYDVYGNMVLMIDSANNKSEIKYDVLGRKKAINDPDKGYWSYEYDVLGNLISQTDALKQTTTFKYDNLNRMISRTDKAGTSTWEYDTQPHGIGKLATIHSVNLVNKSSGEKLALPKKAIDDGLETYIRNYSYDFLGRTIKVDTIIKDNTYSSSYSYDQNSRVDVEIYPNGLAVKNHYNDLGYLVQIKDVQTGKIYWQLNAKDAAGRIISETRSNGLITNYHYNNQTNFLENIETVFSTILSFQHGVFPDFTGAKTVYRDFLNQEIESSRVIQKEVYEYDLLGNVKVHHDPVNGGFEEYEYDDLHRLTKAQIIGRDAQIFGYDDLGNIRYKSDVGVYEYGENNAGPHAVTSIQSKFDGKTIGTFKYDANGDQIEGTLNGEKRTISYTSYSKPLTITTPKSSVSFYYNADREKFARVDYIKGASKDCEGGKCIRHKVATTHYLGNYEVVTIDNGSSIVTQQKAYVGPNTIYIKTQDDSNSKNNTTKIHEVLHDNLGSVTDITDENANVVQHFAYLPFGEQNQTKGEVPYHPTTYKGFTGHEQISVGSINLIHMDGRIYDPVLGRFLSADPFVQDPGNSQSLNRYSYCINNPLAFTDPTGFNFLSSVWRGIKSVFESSIGRIAVGVAVGIGLAIASCFIPALVPVAGAWWKAAIIGGVTTTGIGLATGVGWKQALFEGAAAFAISGSLLYAYEAASLKAAGAGIGGGGGAAEYDKRQSKEEIGDGWRSSQGDDFSDKSFYNSSNDGASSNYADYAHNEMPSVTSDRINGSSIIGGTQASRSGGNFGNGAWRNSRPSFHDSVKICSAKLCGDPTFLGLASLVSPISKKYAVEHGLVSRAPKFGNGSRFTNILSMMDQKLTVDINLPKNIRSMLKTDNVIFKSLSGGTRNIIRGVGRQVQKYGIGGYAAGYVGACVYDQQFREQR